MIPSSVDTRILYCTCPNTQVAETIARRLVEQHAAACVNLIPHVISFYRWQDKIEQDQEVLLMIKSTAHKVQHIIDLIKDLHPYELPEVIAVPIVAGNPPYLSWICANTAT